MYNQGYACLFTALLFLATLPPGWAETKIRKVLNGQCIKLPSLPNLNLQDGSEILWSFKPEESAQAQTLAYLIGGKWDQLPQGSFSGKVKLNKTTGALTLGPVGIGHSGYYYGQITEGDGTVHHFKYNISVINPDPIPSPLTTKPPRNIPKDPTEGKDNSAVIAAVTIPLAIILSIFIFIIVIIVVRRQKKKETNSSSSPSISMDTESGTQQPAPNVEEEQLVVEQ